MAILGKIDGIPIYSTKNEALIWGKRNNLKGYHTHQIGGKIGYMGGDDHSKAKKKIKKIITVDTIPTPPPPPPPPPIPPPTPTPTTITTPPPTTGDGGY